MKKIYILLLICHPIACTLLTHRGCFGWYSLFAMATHWTTRLIFCQFLFSSSAQSWSILPQKQKTKRTVSALPQPCARHVSTQLCKKHLVAWKNIDKHWTLLNFQLERTLAHIVYESSQHTQKSLEGCYYRGTHVQLQKESNPHCLEVKAF